MEDKFFKDLEKSQKYEQKFAEWYNKNNKRQLTWLNNKHEADYVSSNGKKIEIKVDFTRYPNFFIETFSNFATKRVGGPWQALNYNAEFFVYWFVGDNSPNRGKVYVFNTYDLVKFIEGRNYPIGYVKNNGYTTQGLVVPVRDLCNLEFCKYKNIGV